MRFSPVMSGVCPPTPEQRSQPPADSTPSPPGSPDLTSLPVFPATLLLQSDSIVWGLRTRMRAQSAETAERKDLQSMGKWAGAQLPGRPVGGMLK